MSEIGTFFANYPGIKIALVGALSGLLAAAKVDFDAFRAFKSLDQYVAYDWRLAIWRWAQGAFYGALATTPFGQFVV